MKKVMVERKKEKKTVSGTKNFALGFQIGGEILSIQSSSSVFHICQVLCECHVMEF